MKVETKIDRNTQVSEIITTTHRRIWSNQVTQDFEVEAIVTTKDGRLEKVEIKKSIIDKMAVVDGTSLGYAFKTDNIDYLIALKKIVDALMEYAESAGLLDDIS